MRRFKKLFVTILVVATILGTASAFTSAASLLDVEGTKYADSVGQLVGIGVIQGFPDGTFKPAATITRAQMAAVMVRSLGFDSLATASKGATPFSDVPATHWASGYVNVAYNKSIINGMGDGTFHPEDPVTYAQAITMLVRATGHAGEVVGAWPTGYVEVAQKLGLTSNVDFSSTAPATRGDVAIMTDTAVFTVTDPTSGASLAWSVFKLDAYKPDKTAPVITLTSPTAGQVNATTATVSGSVSEAATVKVNGTAVTLGAGNSFTTTVDLANGDNTIKVEAVDAYSNAATPVTVVVTRVGDAASVSLTPSSANVVAGGTQAFVGKVLDANGLALTGATITYTVDKGTIAADGTYTAPTTMGTATVTATAGTLSATATVTITAGELKTVTVSPAPPDLAAGQTLTFTAKGYDANNNEVAITPVWSVDNNGVISTAGVFAGAAGTYTVTATVGSLSGTATANVAGAAAKVTLTASKTTIKANGTSVSTITATLQDANGNTVVGDSASKVTFTKVGPGTLPATTQLTLAAGVASIDLTSTTTTGIARVTGTSNLPGVTGSYVDVTLAAQTVTQVKTSVDLAQVSADAATVATVSATLADEDGVKVTSATNVVTFNVSGTDYFTVLTADGDANTAGYQVTAVGGVATFQVRSKAVPGAISITASATGLTSDAGRTINSVATGPSAKLVIVGPLTSMATYAGADTTKMMAVKVQVQDYQGNVVTSNSVTAVTLTATENGTGGASTTINGGATQTVSQGQITFYVKDTESESVDFTAAAAGLTSAAKVTGSFIPGDPAEVAVVSVTPGSISADGVATAVVKAAIRDANHNVVPTATNLVTFSRTAGTATTLPSTLAVNAVNGYATITVTSKTTPDAVGDTFDATAVASDGTTALTNVAEANAFGTNKVNTVLFGMPNNLNVVVSGTATAGTAKDVMVQVRDYLNQVITNNNSASITLSVDGSASVAANPVTVVNGVATFSITDTKAETVNITANGLGLTQATGTLTVNASTLASVALKSDRSGIAADGASTATITAVGYDAYGNTVTPSEVVTLSYSPTSTYGTLVGNANVDGSASGTFTASMAPGTVTFSGTATTAGVTVAPVTITTYIPVTAYSLRFQTLTAATAGTAKSVKVELLDYNGNVLTGNTGTSIALAQNSGGHATFVTPQNTANGVATFSLTDNTAETLTLTASAAGLVSGTTSLGVNAAAADHYVIAGSPTWITADGIAQSVLSIKIVDAYGNTVTTANGSMTLANSATASGALNTTSVTISSGVNSNIVILTSKTVVGSPVISGTISGITLATPAANVNATISVGTSAATLNVTAPADVNAGSAFNATVTAVDAVGNTVPNYVGTVHFTSTDGAATLPADYTFVQSDAGSHAFSVTLGTAGAQTVTGTDTVTATITGTSSAITVH